MTTYPMHYTDNANSWKRVAMLARLYWPCLRTAVLICALLPLAMVLLSAWIADGTDSNAAFTMSIPLYVIPIFLATRDYRNISAQLPVTRSEKLGFLMLTFLIFFPLLTFLSGLAGELLSMLLFGTDIESVLNAYRDQANELLTEAGINPAVAVLIDIFNTWAMTVVVLYYVVTWKRNRVLAGFVSALIVNVVCGVIAGGVSIALVFARSLASGSFTDYMSQMLIVVLVVEVVILAVIGAIYLVKLYKRLRNSGF